LERSARWSARATRSATSRRTWGRCWRCSGS
jgi:hypothetical protein